jgi:hypothetical protein
MATPAIDYDALARQAGGSPARTAVDYDELARQHGGTPTAAAPSAPRTEEALPGATPQLLQTAAAIPPEKEFEKDRPGKGISLEGFGAAAWDTAKKLPAAIGSMLDPTQGVSGALWSATATNPRDWWGPDAAKSYGERIRTRLAETPLAAAIREGKAAAADPNARAWEVAPAIGGAFTGMSAEQARAHAARGEGGAILGEAAVPAGLTLAAPLALKGVTKLAAPAVRRLAAPLADEMTRPRGPAPFQDVTPRGITAYARQHGIELNAAQRTGEGLPTNVMLRGQQSAGVGKYARSAIDRQVETAKAQLGSNVKRMAETMAPGVEEPGASLQQATQAVLDRELADAHEGYSALGGTTEGTRVDMRPVNELAKRLEKEVTPLVKRGAAPERVVRILEKNASADGTQTFAEAQDARSGLLEAKRHPELAISTRAQGLLEQIVKAIDMQMMEAAASNPQIEPEFRRLNAKWEALQKDFNNPRSPLAQILAEPDPYRVTSKIGARGEVGGSPFRVQLLDRYGIDKAPLKRAVLEDIAKKGFTINKDGDLEGYSPQFLRSVFTPDELSEIVTNGWIARQLDKTSVPYGPSRHIVARALPPSGAARLTNAPLFNRWVTGETAGERLTRPLADAVNVPAKRGVMLAPAIGAAANQRRRKGETVAPAIGRP